MWKKQMLRICNSLINDELTQVSDEDANEPKEDVQKIASPGFSYEDANEPKEDVQKIASPGFSYEDANEPKEDVQKIASPGFSYEDANEPKEDVQNSSLHKYMCGVCKIPVAFCSSFADHLETHEDETFDECSSCTELFESKREYYQHLMNHVKEGPQPCSICSKTYITWLRLRCHLNWHDKKFLCHLCVQTFVNKEHLDKHLVLHTAEEYGPCKICNKRQSENPCLQMPVPPKQPFICSTCNIAFGKKSSLSAHQRKHRFPCQVCAKEFRGRDDWSCHIRCDHPDRYFSLVLQKPLIDDLRGSHSESLTQIDLTSRFNGSHKDAIEVIALNGCFNSSQNSKVSNEIDFTSHFDRLHTDTIEVIDLTGD